jgi:hypothetical protein
MNSTENTEAVPPVDRISDIEHTIRIRIRAELADLGLRRGSWRVLRTLANGPASAEQIRAQARPGGAGRGGRGHGHRHFGRGFGPGFDRFASEEERAEFIERMRAHREQRHGERPCREERSHEGHSHGGERTRRDHPRSHRIHAVLGDFAGRGWVTFDDGVATLTEEGRTTHDAAVERIRALLASLAADIK